MRTGSKSLGWRVAAAAREVGHALKRGPDESAVDGPLGEKVCRVQTRRRGAEVVNISWNRRVIGGSTYGDPRPGILVPSY